MFQLTQIHKYTTFNNTILLHESSVDYTEMVTALHLHLLNNVLIILLLHMYHFALNYFIGVLHVACFLSLTYRCSAG